MRKSQPLIIFAAIVLAFILTACSQKTDTLKSGYYTAVGAEFDTYGWKEYVTIYVSDNKIVSIEYDAKDASGYIKSWDMTYMRTMNRVSGSYPNYYTRSYKTSLLNRQLPEDVDVVTGATHSHNSFQLLAQAVIDHAKAGDKSIAEVDLSSSNHNE